jgi:hypothetical protein
MTVVFTGKGNVSQGAQEIFDLLPVKRVRRRRALRAFYRAHLVCPRGRQRRSHAAHMDLCMRRRQVSPFELKEVREGRMPGDHSRTLYVAEALAEHMVQRIPADEIRSVVSPSAGVCARAPVLLLLLLLGVNARVYFTAVDVLVGVQQRPARLVVPGRAVNHRIRWRCGRNHGAECQNGVRLFDLSGTRKRARTEVSAGSGEAFDSRHYYAHPEEYEPVFHEAVLPYTTILVGATAA